ncbi:MAG: hypothetical protein HRT88_05000 [Lentisphaeraceae bacterium]|nr:hypothetical protein [Lentisphaeraceae bacterium]
MENTDFSGRTVTRPQIDFLRTGEEAKEYRYNSYIDPSNPDILYSQGELYRIEKHSTWVINPTLPKVDAVKGLQSSRINADTYAYQKNIAQSAHILSLSKNLEKQRSELKREKSTLADTKDKIKAYSVKVGVIVDQLAASEKIIKELKDQNARMKWQLERDKKTKRTK